jgi:hypothetical protein
MDEHPYGPPRTASSSTLQAPEARPAEAPADAAVDAQATPQPRPEKKRRLLDKLAKLLDDDVHIYPLF